MLTIEKGQKHRRRKLRIRAKIKGTAEKPRLSVHKTLKHLYAQVIDDVSGRTLAAVTTNTKAVKGDKKSFCNLASAKMVGQQVAEKAKAAGVSQVVFDRGGFPYHGVVKAVAEAAREAGLKF
jgi:large subunit ribosomal protein L18